MTEKPTKEAIRKVLEQISKQGIDRLLTPCPTRYVEGVEPTVSAKSKRNRRNKEI